MGDFLGLPRQDMQTLKKWCEYWLMILSGGILVEQNVQCADNLMSFQHYVIDAALARMQGRIPLEVLIQRLPNLRIVPEQEIVYLPSILIREFTKFLIQ